MYHFNLMIISKVLSLLGAYFDTATKLLLLKGLPLQPSTLGTPGNQSDPQEHLYGGLQEELWYYLCLIFEFRNTLLIFSHHAAAHI